MTPEASFDTGLDVLSVRKLNRRSVPRIAWQVFAPPDTSRGVTSTTGMTLPECLVTSETPFPVQVDGDVMRERTHAEITLARDALWVVA